MDRSTIQDLFKGVDGLLKGQEEAIRAATDVFRQMDAMLRHGSHGPTRMQWLMLGGALADVGVKLEANWAEVFNQPQEGEVRA